LRSVEARSFVAGLILALGLVFFECRVVLAETEENRQWSIDFNAVSISEAFDQLTRITGIKIFATTPLAHNISPKRYVNQSIDQILKDMLKHVNYAAVWLYGKGGLESIGILAFDREKAEGHVALSGVERTGTAKRHLPSKAGFRQLRPRRPVGARERPSRRDVLQRPEQGSSAGLTDEEDSEPEEKDEEPVSTAAEVNDASSSAPPDSQVESTADASNEEEASSTEPQEKDKESASSTSPEEKD
jgi:hypothetical protein